MKKLLSVLIIVTLFMTVGCSDKAFQAEPSEGKLTDSEEFMNAFINSNHEKVIKSESGIIINQDLVETDTNTSDNDSEIMDSITEITESDIEGENTLIPNIVIVSDEINQLSYAGFGHYIKAFNAQFQLINNTNQSLEFNMRILNSGEDIPKDKSVFSFMNNLDEEINYILEPNEQKEFDISQDNATIIGYLGEHEVGGIGGIVYEVQLKFGNKWYTYSLNDVDNKKVVDEVLDISQMTLLRSYDKQILELGKGKDSYDYKLEELNNTILDLQKENKVLPEYTIFKYPEASGLMFYDGSKPIKIYPSNSVQDLYDNYKPGEMTVNCRAVVDCETTNWGMIQFNGQQGLVTGFVEYSSLSSLEPTDLLNTVEALGGFKLGDRIEKYIGILNREYVMLYENGPIYIFPDLQYSAIGGHERVFDGSTSIDVFPGSEFGTWLVRTDSPLYALNCGYKVGDNAKEVLDYFENNYTVSDSKYWGEFEYNLTEDESISFRLSQGETLEERVIESIWIHQ